MKYIYIKKSVILVSSDWHLDSNPHSTFSVILTLSRASTCLPPHPPPNLTNKALPFCWVALNNSEKKREFGHERNELLCKKVRCQTGHNGIRLGSEPKKSLKKKNQLCDIDGKDYNH